MKRLFVGGLGATVTEKDLKDRFGKFGDVSDVEIITRKDDQGARLMTFGYININITDDEYRRCVGVLNKSTWKGGTLVIQLAKESFLQRLNKERQQLSSQANTPAVAPRETLKDAFRAAGVENFHMKAAVPGTEIPGHKDWVVSKFGRVLPVLNLKGKGKKKVFKYDPSKHCHNIKRLETGDDCPSVSSLTWEMEGGEDEISKKRRGEFPKQKPRPKKFKVDLSLFLSSGLNAPKLATQINGLPSTRRRIDKGSIRVFDSDADSEDEIKMLLAQEKMRSEQPAKDDDNLEVVGDDFKVKSTSFWGESSVSKVKEGEEYDSADTDEIFIQRKTPNSKENESLSISDDDASRDSDYDAMMGNCYRLDLSLTDLEKLAKNVDTNSEEEPVEEPKPRKLQSPKKGYNPEDILASLLQDKTPEVEIPKRRKSTPLPAFIGTKELFGDLNPALKRVSNHVDSESNKRLKQDTKLKQQSITVLQNKASDSLDSSSVESKSKDGSTSKVSQTELEPSKSENKPRASKTSNKSSNKTKPNKASSSKDASNEESKNENVSNTSSEKQLAKTNLTTKKRPEVLSKTPIKPSKTKFSIPKSDSSGEDSANNVEVVSTSKVPPATELEPTKSQTKPWSKKTSNTSNNQIKPDQASSNSEASSEESECGDVFNTSLDKNLLKTNLATKKRSEVLSQTLIKPSKMKPLPNSDSSSEESESEDEHVPTSKVSPPTELEPIKPCPKKSSNKSNTPIKQKSTQSNSSCEQNQENPDSFPSETSSTKQLIKSTHQSKTEAPHKTPVKLKQDQSSSSGDVKGLNPKDTKLESHPKVFHSAIVDAQKQQLDNQRRIAALQQRQKDGEQQKKLIKGALSNVDTVKPNNSKHIVFDSEEDDDDDSTSKPEQSTTQKSVLFDEDSESDDEEKGSSLKEKEKASGSKLFESEEEDNGPEEDPFQIKPQFEGKAGEKLMRLQARLGNDSRFKIDARFLESDGETENEDQEAPVKDAEEELLEEKKKSLDILQSILKTSIQPQNSRKGKIFKDISGLHYDPSREEHTSFETKVQPVKESKAARKKKRDELEKLPEVSKEIYFDVSGDLKEVFGGSKGNQEKEKVSWDEVAEDLPEPMEVSTLETSTESTGGFKFSFFSTEAAVENKKTDAYQIETLKAAKFSWQTDPRFQDSSSDEEEAEQEDQMATDKIIEDHTPSRKSFFFFFQGDERLKEGPVTFCRSGRLGDQREAWEEKRMLLKEECRKKHRDAKKQFRVSQKT